MTFKIFTIDLAIIVLQNGKIDQKVKLNINSLFTLKKITINIPKLFSK